LFIYEWNGKELSKEDKQTIPLRCIQCKQCLSAVGRERRSEWKGSEKTQPSLHTHRARIRKGEESRGVGERKEGTEIEEEI
jgi:hypothetical protein